MAKEMDFYKRLEKSKGMVKSIKKELKNGKFYKIFCSIMIPVAAGLAVFASFAARYSNSASLQVSTGLASLLSAALARSATYSHFEDKKKEQDVEYYIYGKISEEELMQLLNKIDSFSQEHIKYLNPSIENDETKEAYEDAMKTYGGLCKKAREIALNKDVEDRYRQLTKTLEQYLGYLEGNVDEKETEHLASINIPSVEELKQELSLIQSMVRELEIEAE